MQFIEFINQDLKSILTKVEDKGHCIKFSTIFTYPDGTVIDIFYMKEKQRFTDLGETLAWLDLQNASNIDYYHDISKICKDEIDVNFDYGQITILPRCVLTWHFLQLLQVIIRVSALYSLRKE